MRLPALALLVLLSACMVGPDYTPPTASLPAAWESPSASAERVESLAGWWRRFDDPVLTDLMERAARGNADVAQAAARLRQARALLGQQQAGTRPTLDGSASATRQRQTGADGRSSVAGDGAVVGNSFQAGFDATFELDVFGGARRAVESSSAEVQATRADLADTMLTLCGDVARSYVDLRAYQARLTVARETVDSRRDTLRLTEAMARAGTGTTLDAMRARAELESAEATIPPLEDGARQAMHRLAVLTGETPATVRAAVGTGGRVPRLAGTITPDPVLSVLDRRPDVRAAERRIAVATADIGVAEADRLPAVSLAGTVGLNASRLRSMTTLSTASVWSFGPQVDLPLFDAGRREAVVTEKTAIRDERIAAWRATVLTAIEEVENALTALDREKAHNAALTRTVAAYADALALAQVQYRAGLAAYLDVLDAQRSLATARDTLVQSDAALATAAVALFKALGGGWEPTP
ncbi:efflux transporter outer membrane subunit [Azospirillum oleiclasticum]|nr:efflux transporter outer membrane subunit [Azospirillum oleiclasticum]